MSNATKTCLDCAMSIPATAKKCPYCQEWQDATERRNKARADQKSQLVTARAEASQRLNRTVAIVLLVGVVLFSVVFYVVVQWEILFPAR